MVLKCKVYVLTQLSKYQSFSLIERARIARCVRPSPTSASANCRDSGDTGPCGEVRNYSAWRRRRQAKVVLHCMRCKDCHAAGSYDLMDHNYVNNCSLFGNKLHTTFSINYVKNMNQRSFPAMFSNYPATTYFLITYEYIL